ncbi:Ring finger domain-containing protein [Colletotrichum higginsianum IMI 349063]|uniref:RING-type E3 ubiquitin transferase n=1 Tax=Colletotrichum higginsianum (strain IMI 349063) TaxID=759273 RepID=A0A1B7YDV4_COLHI|nr:Ring finger domain-containing protein [Colletotrichum higginsianum IMI 349063]OBR10090.1 Ring finger domain-containing protein [Colletotrichum higginsianum IMI 349063]
MSLEQIRNVVLLFSNPVWSGANTIPSTLIKNITSLSRSLAYQDTISANLTTLSTTNSETHDGIIRGLLYIPDLSVTDPCYEQQYDIIPRNATTQATLPPSNYNLIALAPWFNATCTRAYLASARLDPIRAFIFYRPNNSTREPQGADSPIWDLEDGDAWRSQNRFPIFAIPGAEGNKMMRQLSLYSGNISQIPFGDQIEQRYEPHDDDFVRIWTELTVKDRDSVPAMWTWILTVVGVVLFIIACLSLTMHLVQRRRRISLRRRVLSGEVDLEAMGIKRVTVPVNHVKGFPLFTYSFQPEMASTPSTTRPPKSLRSPRSMRTDQRTISESTTARSRARRASMNSSTSTVATNYQPQCHICLENYLDRESIIRELPCGHIFHPECIDEFLSLNSSLCPICKRNMLPRNYCPKITNGMVRRERAIRRLRERVVLDESDDEEAEVTSKHWGKRLFGTDKAAPPRAETPMTPVLPAKSPKTGQESANARTTSDLEAAPLSRTLEPTQEEQEDSDRPLSHSEGRETSQQQPQPPRPAAVAQHSHRNKRRKTGGLRLHVPSSDDSKQANQRPEGRKSPSALARARMRALAGTPFDDPEGRSPAWKRYVVKVFPGFS